MLQKMKQKIVVKIRNGGKECSSKAMKTAAGLSGVESIALAGENKDHIEVIGNNVDGVYLTRSMRKKLGFAELISVAPVRENETNEVTTEPTPHYMEPAWTPYPYPLWLY